MKPLTFGSLFDGVGLFSLALARVGMVERWSCEIDEECRRVAAARFPGVEQHPDVRHVGRHNLEPVDVVVGGSPCQDWSNAGRRLGLDGERSRLFDHLPRIAAEVGARFILFENVPGLLCQAKGEDFAVVLREFSGLHPQVPEGGWQNAGFGYGPRGAVAWRIYDCQYFGLAQRRKRVFVVVRLGDFRGLSGEEGRHLRGLLSLPLQILSIPDGLQGDPPPRRKKGPRPARATAPGPRVQIGPAGSAQEEEEGRPDAGACAIAHQDADADATAAAIGPLSGDGSPRRGCRIGAEDAAGGNQIASQQGGSLHHPTPEAFQASGVGWWREGDVTLAASDDNQGNQVVLQPPEDAGPVGTLMAHSKRHGHATMGTQQAAEEGHVIAYQGQGSNVGPMGTLRAGNGNEAGGVPFVVHSAQSCAKERHAYQADVARSLDTTGGFASAQGGTVVGETAPCLRTNQHNNSDAGMESQMLVAQEVVGPLVTHRTPRGHGQAGVNSQAVSAGHDVACREVAAPLTAGESRKAGVSNSGRRMEDDVNLVASPAIAFHSTQDPVSGSVSPAMGTGNKEGCGSIAVAYNVIGGGQTSQRHAYETEVSGCLQHKGLAATGNEAGTLVGERPEGEPYTLHGSPATNVASEAGVASSLRSRTPGTLENSTTEVVVGSLTPRQSQGDYPPHKGGCHAPVDETDAREVLRFLRQEVGEEAFLEWSSRIAVALQQEEVLQPDLLRQDAGEREVRSDTTERRTGARQAKKAKGRLRKVRPADGEGRPPQERGLQGQPGGEPGADLPPLPQPEPQQTWGLLDPWMRSDSQALRVLRHARPALQEARRSSGLQDPAQETMQCGGVRPAGQLEAPLRQALHASQEVGHSPSSSEQKGGPVGVMTVRRLTPT